MLTSRLSYLPLEVCTIFEGTQATDIPQRVKNVETLLLFLLQREEEDWPGDLVKGLEEADQSAHAQTLQEEYDAIVKDEQMLEQTTTPQAKQMTRFDFSEVRLYSMFATIFFLKQGESVWVFALIMLSTNLSKMLVLNKLQRGHGKDSFKL